MLVLVPKLISDGNGAKRGITFGSRVSRIRILVSQRTESYGPRMRQYSKVLTCIRRTLHCITLWGNIPFRWERDKRCLRSSLIPANFCSSQSQPPSGITTTGHVLRTRWHFRLSTRTQVPKTFDGAHTMTTFGTILSRKLTIFP